MFLRKRIGRLLVLLALIGLSTAWVPDAARATHYPEGASCYDCHATSGSKMVLGTKMVKASAATVALGMSGGVPVPCLFCHRAGAVSGLADSTVMKPVDGQFGSGVTSKHDASFTSSFTPTGFDCLSCHPGASISNYVDYNATTGDANVHGVDAKTQYIGGGPKTGVEADRVTGVFSSLVNNGSTPTPTNIQPTCAAATCHGGATDNTIGGRVAKMLHPMGAGYTDCVDCHASHRGEKQGSLVVLLKDGTVDPQDGTAIPASSYVTPADCGECHAAIVTDHNTKGHGKVGIAVSCETCHSDTVPHSFATGGTPATKLRFGLAVADAGVRSSILRQQPPYNQPYSICLTCHAVFADKLHGTADVVGCADCHEPHGIGVGANIMMIRAAMPKIDSNGTPVYIAGGVYDPVVYTSPADNFPASITTGLCDNAECHSGQKNANNVDIYPLDAFMNNASGHTGGDVNPGEVCDTCHSHTDAAGSWGAASSCDGCHGNPPATNVHAKHAAAGFLCDSCHTSPGTGALHKELPIANATQFNDLWSTAPLDIRRKIDLSVPYSISKGAQSSMATYGDCTTACHGTALAAASQGSDIAPTWNVPASGACGTCHKDKTTNPFSAAGNVHKKHAADRNVGCEVCHSATYTGTALNYPEHVNGSTTSDVDLKAGATFNGAAVTMTYNAGSCSNISCHGAWKAITWNAADSCANCHSYPPDGTGGTTNHDATAPVDKTIAELKSAHGNCTTCHGVSAASDVTQNSFGVPSDTTASGGDAYVVATNHVDAKVQMNGISAPNNNQSAEYDEVGNGCNKACHDNTYKITQIRANTVELKELGAGSCDGCHGGAGAFWPNTAGFVDNAGSEDDDSKHTVHMTALAQRVYGESLAVLITTTGNGAPDVKQKALCEYCHAAVTNDDGHTTGDDAEVFVTNIATISTRFAKNMKTVPGPDTDADAAYAAGACTNVDCHNNKSTAPTYNWYTAATTNCMMCHTVGSGNNPVSGLHNAARISANPHDDSFKITPAEVTPSGVCTTCHTTMPAVASQTSTHIDAIFQGGVGQSVQMGLFANYTQSVDNVGTCATTGGLSTCHSDGGAWNRVWNANAANSDGAECANCHGGLTTGYVTGAFAAGVTQRHSDPQLPGNHATCDYCHEYNNGSTTPYNLGTMHRDGNIQLNATVVGDLGYTESGTAPNKRIGCSNCHSATDDAAATYADGKHEFNMVTDGTRWTRTNIDGGAYNCTGCHATDAPHTGTGMSSAVHTTHANNTGYAPTCNVCHLNNGPGDASHFDGTVNFGGTRMTTAFNYTRASNNFSTGANCTGVANGCHDAAASTWTAPATITCANCHNVGSNGVVDAGKLMDQGIYPPNSASHTPHLTTTTGAGATCNDCHGTNATTGTHTGHKNNLITVAGAAATYTGGLVPRDASNAGTCGTNTCHNNGQNAAPDTPGYAWGTAVGGTNTCVECHGDTAVLMTTQAHSAHLNVTVGTFGRTIACSDCHGASPQTQVTHANGAINLSGFTYTGGDVAVTTAGGTFGTCGVNSCHNDGTGAAQATNPAWNAGAQPNCTICHQDTTTMASNAHNEHMNASYTGAACIDCHTAATVATHLNGSTTFDAAKVTYSKGATFVNDATASGTCLSTSCHNKTAGVGQSAAWDTAGDLACDACHYWSATPTAVGASGYAGGGANAMSVSHGDHFTTNKTCLQCHAAVTTTAHITGKTSLADGAVAALGEGAVGFADATAVTDYTYTAGTHTCTAATNNGLGCHATGAPDWDIAIAATGCTDCHTDLTTAAVNPVTGIHNAARISANAHDGSWDYDGGDGAVTADCTTCHTTAPSASHANGTFAASSPTVVLAATVGFTDGATPTCGPNGAMATCHGPTATNGDGGTWARKWSATAANSDGTECANCHGGMNQTDWTFGSVANITDGSVEHERDWDVDATAGEVSGYHKSLVSNGTKCNICHVYADAPYSTMGWGAGNSHGNNSIDMNSTAGYTQGTWNCTTHCHFSAGGNTNHNLEDSGWAVASVAGPAMSCTSCHGGDNVAAGNNNYWPGNAGALYPNRPGEHNAHITELIAQLGYNIATLTDQQQKTMCGYCHTYTTNPGEAGHDTGGAPAEVSGFNPMWSALTANYPSTADGGTAGSYTAGNGTNGVCSNVDCHNNVPTLTTPTAYDWYDNAATACGMCHTAGEADTTHQAHVNAAGTIGYNAVCTDCHGAGTTSTTHPTAGHVNGAFAVTSALVRGAANTVTYSGFTYPSVKGTCGTNICHTRGYTATAALVAPKTSAYTWGTAITGCDACHDTTNVGLTTFSHTAHLTTTTGGGGLCTECHIAASNANHLNGAVNMGGTIITLDATYLGNKDIKTEASYGGCGTNTCHNNGQLAAPDTPAYTWNTAVGVVNTCIECHGDTAALMTTQAHAAHLNSSVATFGRTIACADCHGASPQTQATHGNGTINLSGFTYTGGDVTVATLGGTFGTCGVNSCHNDGTGATQATNPAWNAAAQPNCTICHQDTTTMASAAHNEHMNAGYTGAACIDCHTAATVATHLNGSTTFDAAKVTYSKGATFVNDATASGTCLSASCHNKTAGVGQSAAWDTAGDLACDACHYWSATPTAVGASGYAGGGANAMSVSHGDHFTATKACNQCHVAVTTTAHINGKTSLADGAVATYNGAGVGEAAAAFTDAAAVTDYTYNTSTHTCTAATNNGMGCHATGTTADWDVAFATTACTNCHSDTTTAAVNPTSGLHSVVPSVTAEQHDSSFAGAAKGCVDCHNITTAVTTHANNTFTDDGISAGNKTILGLQNFTYTSTLDDAGTCVGTAAGCHDVTRNTWAHKWDSTASYYTTSPSACGGCHGINAAAGFNTGVDHKATATMASTHGGTGAYDCQECHMMEYNGGVPYTFTFGTDDWTPLNATSKHGNSVVEINSKATYNETTFLCEACHSTATYQFADTAWTIDKTLTGPDFSGCNVCHGSPATGQYWPNGTPGSSETPPASATYDYADNASGAHQTHIDAIGTVRGWSTVQQKNQTCNYCHPNPGTTRTGSTDAGDHKNNTVTVGIVDVFQDGRVASETQYFKTLAGANDSSLATAAYNNVAKTCANIDCHGDVTTPAWMDLAGPTFSPNNTITVTNPVSDGDLSISWNPATDALSPPVKFDLYRHTAAGDACTLGATIATNLGSLGYIDSGLTNGATYYYCVKAKDSSSPANTTSSTTANAAPTSPTTSPTYYLTKRTTGTIWGANSYNTPACGTTGTVAAATTTPATVPYLSRGGLDTAEQCAVSTSNYLSNSSPNAGGPGTTFENMLSFYTSTPYATAKTVTGLAAGNNLYLSGSAGTEVVRLWLAAMDSAGVHTLSASSVNVTATAIANIGTAKAPNLSTLTVNVPAGGRLALLMTWSDSTTTTSTFDRILVDNYAATMQSRIAVQEAPAADSTAPTYTSTSLVATDAGVGGSVDLTWTAATDTSTPIHYDVYASTSNVPATLFASPVQTSISTNSTRVTGLTNGTPYYFGVRAADAFNNTDTNTFVSAAATPTASSGGNCTTCHGMPPSSGAHLVHATSSVNDCNKCHGNTTYMPSTAYTNGYTPSIHADGTKNMWFQRKADGSASGDTDAAWGGTTCTNVNCHFNVTTPNWVGGTTTCATCHAFPPVAASGTVDHDANINVSGTLANFLTKHNGCETCHGATSSDGTATGTFTTNANYPAGSHGDGLIRMNGPDATPGPAAGAEYNETNRGCDNACHANSAEYQITQSSARAKNYADFGGGCASCHDTGVSGAPIVTASSSHVDADGAGATYAPGGCSDCHPFHADNTYGTNDVGIPTQRTTPVAGTVPSLNYSYSTHFNAISLGGAATAGYAKSTEAEICWACHDAVGISEWGANNNATTGSIAYNYGSLYNAATGGAAVSNWTSAFWRSGTIAANATNNFSYKTGLITSTHSVNFNSGTAALLGTANGNGYRYGSATVPDSGGTLASPTLKETRDTVANIRCSYCHDVHGTHNGVGGDVSGGAGVLDQPYLRGKWKGNPYPEDGAPRSGWTNWTDNANYGRVPRASASSTNTGVAGTTKLGGFWIDQNSGNPNSGLNTLAGADSTSGLCALCHGVAGSTGNVNGTWTQANLDGLDYVTTGEAAATTTNLWVSGATAGADNGHKNVVLGGTGSTLPANNIFTRAKRGSVTRNAIPTGTAGNYLVDMGQGTSSGGASVGGYSYRGLDADPMWLPPVTTRSAYAWQKFAWNDAYNSGTPTAGSAKAAGTADLNVGNMASGTTASNTETASYNAQSKYHTFNCGKCHNPHASRLPKLMITNCLDTNHNTWDNGLGTSQATTAPAPWTSKRDSQWPSAQNCHRLDEDAAKSSGMVQTKGLGWNRVTPWVESNTPSQ